MKKKRIALNLLGILIDLAIIILLVVHLKNDKEEVNE